MGNGYPFQLKSSAPCGNDGKADLLTKAMPAATSKIEPEAVSILTDILMRVAINYDVRTRQVRRHITFVLNQKSWASSRAKVRL